jgi:hypothetical protein
MEQIVSRSLSVRRFTMLVLIIFAVAALLLAAVGIYGVMSYAPIRRTHELGIRARMVKILDHIEATGSSKMEPRHARSQMAAFWRM